MITPGGHSTPKVSGKTRLIPQAARVRPCAAHLEEKGAGLNGSDIEVEVPPPTKSKSSQRPHNAITLPGNALANARIAFCGERAEFILRVSSMNSACEQFIIEDWRQSHVVLCDRIIPEATTPKLE